ncbi:hypothetical protein MCGFDL_MCGFDL_17105, partial [Dysosmobacter welbionis]
ARSPASTATRWGRPMEAFCHVPYQNIQQDLSRRPEPPGSGAVRRLRFGDGRGRHPGPLRQA